MDALGFALMAAGAYLLYAAYKNEQPWARTQQVLAAAGSPTPTPFPGGQSGGYESGMEMAPAA